MSPDPEEEGWGHWRTGVGGCGWRRRLGGAVAPPGGQSLITSVTSGGGGSAGRGVSVVLIRKCGVEGCRREVGGRHDNRCPPEW